MKKLLLIGLLALSACSIQNPGQGEKVGQIARLTDEGVMCTTTTALITGKFGGGELKVTVPTFLRAQVQHFQETQEQVEIRYHVGFITSACSNDTEGAFMDSIETHPEGAAVSK